MADDKTDIAKVAEHHRVAWIRTILSLSGSEANRRAFMSGYNGDACPPPVTASKADKWHQGNAVHDILNGKR